MKHRGVTVLLLLAIVLLSSCAGEQASVGNVGEPTAGVVLELCTPDPVVPPTPAFPPGYAQLDETTGLHFTGTYYPFDFETWALVVEGEVYRPLALTYDEIRCMEKVEADPLLVCPGFFEDQFTWAGVRVADVVELAGPTEEATRMRIYGRDGYSQRIELESAMMDESILAWEWEGETLPAIHGFPLRAVFPEEQGNKWVKWIERIVIE